MITISHVLGITALLTTSNSVTLARDVEFCDLARSPALYEGQVVRFRAIESGNLDNIPWIMSLSCSGNLATILYSREIAKGALDPLNDYRAPESVTAGPFYIWATYTGRVRRETPRTGYMLNDTGYHFSPIFVSDVEAISAIP